MVHDGFAIIVIVFGIYRIRLRSGRSSPKRAKGSEKGGGFCRMGPRAHRVIGVLYLALGAALVATSLGWNPFGSLFGPKPTSPRRLSRRRRLIRAKSSLRSSQSSASP